MSYAIDPTAAARIRKITAMLGPDVVAQARQRKAWRAPRGCTCPWTWHDPAWDRNPAATCGIHTLAEQRVAEVS